MKAAVLHKPGGPENFQIETRPMPEPGKNQVMVKVKAFGLNRSELMTRKGYSSNVTFPPVLGIECVGEIVSDPSGEYQPGQLWEKWGGHMMAVMQNTQSCPKRL